MCKLTKTLDSSVLTCTKTAESPTTTHQYRLFSSTCFACCPSREDGFIRLLHFVFECSYAFIVYYNLCSTVSRIGVVRAHYDSFSVIRSQRLPNSGVVPFFTKRAKVSRQQAQVETTTKPEDFQTLISRAVLEAVLGQRPYPEAAAREEMDRGSA